MFRNYLKTAIRNLLRNKSYAAINISGLAVGIAACLLIGIYIMQELSFDKFHTNASRIVRVTMEYNFGDAETKTALTGTKVGPEFSRRFPEVEAYARTLKFTRVVKYEDKSFEEEKFLYADSAFLSMFSFPLVSGNAATALNSPDKIVITRDIARKYFGSANPIGKVLRVGENRDFMVTGVTEAPPSNSQIQFDFIASFSSLNASKVEKWWEANYVTYLLLSPNAELQRLKEGVGAYMKQVSKEELKIEGSGYLAYHLEPLTSVHLRSALDGFEPNNNITYIYILAVVAFLILCIASVNYTNLATAQSATRTAEIGIRKVMGAEKFQVFRQFIGESLLITIIAMALALLLAYVALPFFNRLSGKELETSILFEPATLLVLAVTGIVVSLAAGAYPALVLSNLRLINILKSGFSFTSGRAGIRKSLIVFQFAISIFLLIATTVVLQQLHYIRNKELGYDKEHVLVLPMDNTMRSAYNELKKSFKALPQVKNVGAAYEEPTDIGWGDGITAGEGATAKDVTVNALPVDEDFIKTMNISIIAGSDYTYSDVLQLDTSNGGQNIRYNFMLNESAVKALGWKPEEAIGKSIAKGAPGTIKAVIKDFHFRSFHNPITPLVVFLDYRMPQKIFVKIAGDNIPATLQQLEASWKQRVAHRPFEYHFLDEDYEALYKTEQRTAGIFSTFSLLAIVLACLGLFGLTAYAVVQRTKEIGIRKILGATIPNIVSLLSKDFLLLVIVAIVVASPLAWFAANRWLQDFTYRVNIQWWVFAVAGIIALGIALLTISFQAVKAAMSNPVKSLRTE
ncbi:MAG TPA: FtsX-like permease family protein [Chitinophagaceae bacterium]|nr:FtsX-like permease family protein [Chitinophagaceae bacterium]